MLELLDNWGGVRGLDGAPGRPLPLIRRAMRNK
jgi:hypothetical protein